MKESELRKLIYYSIDIKSTVQELNKRRQDLKLKKRVKSYLKSGGLSDFGLFDNGPYCALSRSIATPNKEQKRFIKIAGKFSLQPVILEYNSKFVTMNKEKFHLSKMLFNHSKHKQRDHVYLHDIDTAQGLNTDVIKTNWEEKLKDFHHHIFFKEHPHTNCQVIDFTDWFNKTREGDFYYFGFLTLFVQNAILLDNYLLTDKHERPFAENKVVPSIKAVTDMFGLKPLIAPLLPIHTEKDVGWYKYTVKTRKHVEKLMESSKISDK